MEMIEEYRKYIIKWYEKTYGQDDLLKGSCFVWYLKNESAYELLERSKSFEGKYDFMGYDYFLIYQRDETINIIINGS